jgi:host factor-I protein
VLLALESPPVPHHIQAIPRLTPAKGGGTKKNDKKLPENKGKNPMAADKQNLQDAFLNHVRKAKVPVTIFLINGVKLQGVITWFDNFCVLLRRDGQSQLVYKHAISTIMPGAPINLYEGED